MHDFYLVNFSIDGKVLVGRAVNTTNSTSNAAQMVIPSEARLLQRYWGDLQAYSQ